MDVWVRFSEHLPKQSVSTRGASRRPPLPPGWYLTARTVLKKIYAFWSYVVIIPISAILAPMKIRNVCLDIDFALIPCWWDFSLFVVIGRLF